MIVLVRVVNALLLLAALWLLLPRGFAHGLGAGLDVSWQLALHLAREGGLVFGRDILFPYGPLGTLTTRLPIEEAKFELFAADLFLYANVLYIFTLLAIESRTVVTGLAVLACAVIAATGMYFMELPVTLFFVTVFHVFRFVRDGGALSLAAGTVTGLVVFYTKLNLGLAALAIVFAAVCYRLAAHGEGGAFARNLALFALLTGASMVLLPVDPVGYLRGALHIADGYNDAMYLDQPKHRPLVLLTLAPIAGYALYMLVTIPVLFRSKEFPFVLLTLGLATFLLFKQSVVRGDEHVFAFFEFLPLVPALLMAFTRRFARGAAFGLFLLFAGVSGYVARDNIGPQLAEQKLEALQRYAAALEEPPIALPFAGTIPESARLPQQFLDAVTDESVDIIPWNVAAVFYNNLRYNPRPVFQSYAAYDGYLDRLNAEKYSAPHSPDFVVYSPHCIDDRYCFFDETETKLALKRSFSVVNRADDKLLLARRAYPGKSTVRFLSSGESPLSEAVRIPAHDGVLLMTIGVSYTPRGHLERALFKPPPLKVRLALSDGSTRDFRAVLPIVRAGVIVSHFVESVAEAEAFFEGELSALRRVESIRLRTPGRDAYEPRYEYSFYSVEFASE